MSIQFNTLLQHEAKLELSDVRLVRHKDQSAARGKSPYELWRDNRPQFDLYQATHKFDKRSKLNAKYWAVFLGTPSDETLFSGLFRVSQPRRLARDTPMPHRDGVDKAGSRDVYDLQLDRRLRDLIGRLYIEWGPGKRSWIQRADKQNKTIIELRPEFKEPEFPGFLTFQKKLSELANLPGTWTAALSSTRGIYLLTCPRTREQYVGAATGAEGFWGRWREYIDTGHGGNIALKSRKPSDYQVSILEVAGSAETIDGIAKMESHWKQKLQSREMGLNRN